MVPPELLYVMFANCDGLENFQNEGTWSECYMVREDKPFKMTFYFVVLSD